MQCFCLGVLDNYLIISARYTSRNAATTYHRTRSMVTNRLVWFKNSQVCPVWDGELPSENADSSPEKRRLKAANHNQEEIESPIRPIGPILFRGSYRHGGKFADSYGLLCIFGCYGLTFILIATGGIVSGDLGCRLYGWSLIALGLLLGLLATLSGIIGCLPWNWWGCLHDGEEHSKDREFHSGDTVTQKLLTIPHYCNTLI